MMGKRAECLAAVLLSSTEDAGLWMRALFSTDVHIRKWGAES